MKDTFTLAFAAIALIALADHAVAQDIGDAKKGATFAQMACAECHAVGTGRSPNAKAPNFARVAATRGMTPTALRVWLQSSHPTMPNLVLTEEDKNNVIAYILGLKVR